MQTQLRLDFSTGLQYWTSVLVQCSGIRLPDTGPSYGEPNTYHQAMQRSAEEKAKWHNAALNEIQSLIENRTFELVRLPPGQKAMGSHWVFKVKKNADGSVERYKARVLPKVLHNVLALITPRRLHLLPNGLLYAPSWHWLH